MKKQISMILALAAITFGAMAQNPATERCEARQACVKVDSTKCCKAKFKRPLSESRQFEGLSLTEDQKAQINALTPRQNAERIKKEKKDGEKALKENFKNKMRENRRDYLAKIKAILTPEQYTTFLENNFVNASDKTGRKIKGDFKKVNGEFAKDRKRFDKDSREFKKDFDKKMNKDKKDKDKKDKK